MRALPQSLVQPGDVVDGYKVGRLFAKEGGMALLYLVEDPNLPKLPLVMKVLPADSPSDMVARMEREAHALSMLSSARHVVRIHRTGRCADGSPYIVMERLEGEDLQTRLRREGKLPVARAVEIAVQASMGLHACHAERVLHRDIKPGNLFLHHEAELGEVVKIIDFGISHLGMGPAITSLNATSGTRRYMAPEQARGHDDERADQFSLAAVLYEMLAGQLPWPMPKKDDGGAHERLVAKGTFRLLRTVRPDVPEGLEAVVMRGLSPNPDKRFASVFELGRELLPFATLDAQALFRKYADHAGRAREAMVVSPVGQQLTARAAESDEPSISIQRPKRATAGEIHRPFESEYATVARPQNRRPRRGSRHVVGIAGVVALVGVVAWMLRSEGQHEVSRAAGPTSKAPSSIPGVELSREAAARTQADEAKVAGQAVTADAAPGTQQPSPAPSAEGEARKGAGSQESATRTRRISKKSAGPRREGALMRTPQGTAIPD